MKGFLEKMTGYKWAAVIAASLTIVVLSGFLLSGRSAGVSGGFLGPQVRQEKMASTKQMSLFSKSSTNLKYKETMNQSDLPMSERADKYGSYDIYVDEQDTQYVFLADSDLFCGFLKTGASLETNGKLLSEIEARGIADAYLMETLGEDQREYVYESMYCDQSNMYHITYASYIGDFKTDDECIIWVRGATGEIYACSMFNRGRYDSYRDSSLTFNDSASLLMEKHPELEEDYNDCEILDKYLTLSDGGSLVVTYEVYNSQDGCTQEYSIPISQT